MKYHLTYLLILPVMLLQAQTVKDTVELKEVLKVEKVSANVQNDESPFTELKYLQGKRLSDALGEFSSVYVKSYGSGGLASLAIRGASASQTGIEWNGIRLNSPSLGQVDLALFTLGMQDNLQLVRSGYHGDIGGTLRMNNEVLPDSGFSLGATFRWASFKTFEQLTDVQYAKEKLSGATKFSYTGSANNFPFSNTYKEGNPVERQPNGNVKLIAFLQQFNAKLNEHHELDFFLWLNDAQRQIPPVMSKEEGKESQDDYSLRSMIQWKVNYGKFKMKLTSAYLSDKLKYKDPDALLNTSSLTRAVRNKLNVSEALPFNLFFNAEANYDFERADIDAYGKPKTRNIAGVKAYLDYYHAKGFHLHGGFREDLVDKKLSAFAPELAFNYEHTFNNMHNVVVGLLGSRNFRFPTLNDLYWVPGGNPGLKQERSWNGELRLKYAYRRFADFSISNFYMYVDDWIQWLPQGAIWQPVNFKRVFSRGVEATLQLSNVNDRHTFQKFIVHFNASYSFTQCTNLDGYSTVDQSKGAQLIYVPLHSLVLGLQVNYRGFYLRSVNRYTGIVYIATDNSDFLKDYFISDLEIGKDFNLKDFDLGLSFRINNIGNIQYQVVAQRSMPGRSFEGMLRFKFYHS